MAIQVYIIHGPNLNLLGRREPHLYGHQTTDDLLQALVSSYPQVAFHYFQSNHEGRLIDKLQEVGYLPNTAIILNAAAYTHTSIAIGDAVAAIDNPVIEIHLSDIEQRESFRRLSCIRDHAAHFIAGKGFQGYHEAVDFIIKTFV